MVKKALITGLVLSGMLFFGLSGRCFADASALLEQENTYKNTGWHQQARQLYNTIVQQYSGYDSALKAQGEVICLDIPEQQDSQTQAAISTLISDYSEEPNLPAVLCNIAAGYGWSGKFEQASSLYQQVIQQYPASASVAKAQLGISRTNIVSFIKAGDYTAAEVWISEMLKDFSGHPYLPAALYQIARRYQWSREYERAKSIHQEIIQRFPASSEAERARLDAARIKALSLIKSGEYTAAEAETSKLMQEFSGHPGLAVVVHSLASEYERQAKYEKAASLHQQVVQQWPDNARAERARFDFLKTTVLTLIQSGNYSAAATGLGKFTADFGGHRLFAKAMFVVGEQYYSQACIKEGGSEEEQAKQLYQKAITSWEQVRQQSESYAFSAAAWYFSGRCWRRLGDYEKVIECLEKVAADWPGYRHASEAQFLVGRSFEKLAKKGVVSEAEAETKIKAAYQRLVERCPECESTRYAQRWLNRHK